MRQRWHRVWWGLRQEFTWGREELREGRWGWWLNVVAYRVMAVWPWLAATYGSPHSRRTFRLVTRQGAIVHPRQRPQRQPTRRQELYRHVAGDPTVVLGRMALQRLGRDEEARVAFAKARDLSRGVVSEDEAPHEIRALPKRHP